MTELEKLIEIANRLCNRLDKMANEDHKFCKEMQLALERSSCEIQHQINDIQNTYEYYGA